jgi:hypothetical protein
MKEQALYQIWTPTHWIVEYRSVWRKAVLLVFLFCLLSPWATDRIHVPAPNDCSWRLDDDFCATPLSGFWALIVGYSIVIDSVLHLTSGATSGAVRSFPQMLWIFWVVFIPLPAISTLLLLFSHGRFSSQRFQVVLWALAALVGVGLLLVLASTAWDEPLLRLWGVWSYILLAVVAFYLESRLWFWQRRHIPSQNPA